MWSYIETAIDVGVQNEFSVKRRGSSVNFPNSCGALDYAAAVAVTKGIQHCLNRAYRCNRCNGEQDHYGRWHSELQWEGYFRQCFFIINFAVNECLTIVEIYK